MSAISRTVEEQAEAALADVVKDADKPVVPEVDPDREKALKTPGFARMRTDWDGPDGTVVASVLQIVEARMSEQFKDAYDLIGQVYDIVRTPEVDEHGVVKTDRFGFPIWKKTVSGVYEEDFTRLTHFQKEDFLFKVTTRLFDWEQKAANAWGEAMLCKAQWEEAMAEGFIQSGGKTIEDRTQAGRLRSRDERYHAVFLSLYSRKADALVRTMTLLGQRIKDSLG